jgi:hypothetical protein
MSGSISNTGSVSVGSATRDPSQTPFASDSVFNLPLGSGAQWEANAQLSNADVFVNTTQTGYNENIYTGTASDPVVTVTDNATAGGTPATYQVHIPADAVPASGSDGTLSVDDTTSGTWYSFGGFNWTGPNTATVSSGSGQPDNGSGIQNGSDFDEGVGTLTQSDLNAGTIDHMLRIEIPTSMAESYSSTSTSTLAPYAWPQTEEDGFAINGDGGTPYSGTIPYGVTVGIPAGTPEPAAIAANAGANMLWQALQDHGAMVRDTTSGSGNTVVLQADQNVSPTNPLIEGMDQYGAQIMAATEILTNQGPNSVNGGGTPIVPLDPPLSDASAGSTSTSTTSATGSDTASGSTSTPASSTSATSSDPTGTSTAASSTGATSSDPTGTSTPVSSTGATSSDPTGTSTPVSSTGATSGDPTGTSTSTPTTGTTATSGDTAAITPATLSSGQSGSGSSSGMTFVATPGTSGTTGSTSGTSASSVGTDPTSDTSPAATLASGGSGSNFTPPTPSPSEDHEGAGGGHGAWWTTHQTSSATIAAYHG